MIQVKKWHSSIVYVIKNTPTTLDMFLQTNFDIWNKNKTATKIIYLEPCNYGTWILHRFESADVQNVSARTASLAKTDTLSHLI